MKFIYLIAFPWILITKQRKDCGLIKRHEIAKLTDAIAQMGLSDALRTRLMNAEAEKRELLDQIREFPEDLPIMIPRMVERYRSLLDNLPEVFQALGVSKCGSGG